VIAVIYMQKTCMWAELWLYDEELIALQKVGKSLLCQFKRSEKSLDLTSYESIKR